MGSKWKSTESFILLPELKIIITQWQSHKFRTNYKCEKQYSFEVCPKFGFKSYSVHSLKHELWLIIFT